MNLADYSTPSFITIGHLTADLLPDRSFRPGGTVAFAALTARNLGQSTATVTATTASLRDFLLEQGIVVAGPVVEQPTIFENIYTPQGRVQYVRAVAPTIKPADVPAEWTGASSEVQIVHLGPVAQEFDGPELIELFPNALIGITPQGWLRAWDGRGLEAGRVRPILWEKAEKVLSKVTALVLSNEDLPPGDVGLELLQRYVTLTPIVVLTRGANGCLVYQKDRCDFVPALPAQEVDPTGAGDVFATAFFIKLRETHDPLAAASFAHAAAACNIEKPGLDGVPTLTEVLERLKLKS